MLAFDPEVTLGDRLSEHFAIAVAFVIGVLACTRVVRLLVDDDFPPTMWLRKTYVSRVPEAWGGLFECPWCMGPYVVLVDILWAWGSGLAWWWWLPNVWAAASWLVGFLNVRDLPEDQR